jgi:hypothetical protein
MKFAQWWKKLCGNGNTAKQHRCQIYVAHTEVRQQNEDLTIYCTFLINLEQRKYHWKGSLDNLYCKLI